MPIDVVWSRLAREQLLEAYISTGMRNPAAAERWFERVERRVAELALHPRIGRLRADIRPHSRVLVEFPYIILYEVLPDQDDMPVQNVAIIHGRRDLILGE